MLQVLLIPSYEFLMSQLYFSEDMHGKSVKFTQPLH